MSTAAPKDWKKEFGLDDRKPPHFFTSIDQFDDPSGRVPQPHALRRAFEELGVEGVLCSERSPVIYFCQVKKIVPAEIIDLHRSFWNQGIAPILVIIAPDDVHVYSGLIPPEETPTASGLASGFVETLNRIQDQLQSFLFSVESGEYFHIHRRSFDPRKRVDRELLRNLQATRQELGEVEAARLEPQTLDALLCRLVFTCYLFDRGIIGRDYLKSLRIGGAGHMKDILAKKPRTDAKADLYNLFDQLGKDFNGDLFSADLEAESRQVKVEHLDILDHFFHGTDVRTGQQSFWPYDFGIIPIETISAIYEHFLKAAGEEQKKKAGAFYTPRFLAEFILDVVLEGETSLLEKRFLDPACGSGIFLVGLFNRLAEEWNLKNPGASYDRRAKGLMDLLLANLYGVDSNRSACQITSFSLYLAFLDQLSPPDIQKLLGKWDRLPYLVHVPGDSTTNPNGTVCCADFFAETVNPPHKFHVVVGNPPWGPVKANAPATPGEKWCAAPEVNYDHPNREMSVPFVWKAPRHLERGGKVCFVLPHGIIFNHSKDAIRFQRSFFRTHAVERVVNFTDYQRFLFEESEAPAIVLRYGAEKPADSRHLIDYWTPKTDWKVTQTEIIDLQPQDRSRLTICEVLDGLKDYDTPLIWKTRFWATPRDWRLLDRLALMPRLHELVGSPSTRASKRWLIGQGFEERISVGHPGGTKTLRLPTRVIVEATAPQLQLFLLQDDCDELPSLDVQVRSKSNTNTDVYLSPHVLITHGYTKIAFADFNVVFRHALRGIRGSENDRSLLMFLAGYLRSTVARYFVFHTSSNWGVSRSKVHVNELLRLPFPLPEQTHAPKRCEAIVQEVSKIIDVASKKTGQLGDRKDLVLRTQEAVNKLIEEYFDIDDIERMLILDTANVIIPSVRPSRTRPEVPTVKHSSSASRTSYTRLLCDRLNGWANREYSVQAHTFADTAIGVGMVVLEKTRRGSKPIQLADFNGDLLKAIHHLQCIAAREHGTFELIPRMKVFHKNTLYIAKPLGQRFWTNTAALNDADEIAGTILMQSPKRGA